MSRGASRAVVGVAALERQWDSRSDCTADRRTVCRAERGARALEQEQQLNAFLAGVERRALRIAEIGIGDRDEAMDLVQDAMIRLVRKYARRPESEWAPLFFRILTNRVRDSQRRRAVRNRVISWFGGDDDDGRPDPVAEAPDRTSGAPDEQLEMRETLAVLETAIRALPARQQEAFMLRNFEGLDVAATAAAMGCSEGSVKTHYSRAVHSLRARLGEIWK
ncbi:RNA polymerase sigma factor [Lentisalinibacter sediminis]|uniref:RNA polymerase sigma factor n=1 Tax=Lentisalinibacter sediminis TaxID=2992237 RepID=UPI003869119B